MSRRVVIVGGGFAGLAAGVRLSERGHQVVLLERRNHLGGRAYSFIDAKTGDVVDNGLDESLGSAVLAAATRDREMPARFVVAQ